MPCWTLRAFTWGGYTFTANWTRGSPVMWDTQSSSLGARGSWGGRIAGPWHRPRKGNWGCLGWVAAEEAKLCWLTWPIRLVPKLEKPRNGCDVGSDGRAECPLEIVGYSWGVSHPGNLTKSNSDDLRSSPVSTPELCSNKSLYQESDIPLNH